jgi:hypothetical protein
MHPSTPEPELDASQIAQTCDIMDFGRDPTDLWNPHLGSRKITAVTHCEITHPVIWSVVP